MVALLKTRVPQSRLRLRLRLPCRLRLPFISCLVLCSHALATLGEAASPGVMVSSNDLNDSSRNETAPVIFTYHERFNDADADTDTAEQLQRLRQLWSQEWRAAGWEPVVLTLETAQQHAEYDRFQVALDRLHLHPWNQALFRRWMAVSQAGGGWHVDSDVFPLKRQDATLTATYTSTLTSTSTLMTLYQTVAPTMASGSAHAWSRTVLDTLDRAVEHVRGQYTTTTNATASQQQVRQQPYNYWTDTLGLLQLLDNNTYRYPITTQRRVLPIEQAPPVETASDCLHKRYQKHWVVHFGPGGVQLLPHTKQGQWQVNDRAAVAREWLDRWRAVCDTNASASAAQRLIH